MVAIETESLELRASSPRNLFASYINWSTSPESFSESNKILSWTHAVDDRLNFNFSVPSIRRVPESLKITFTPIMFGLVVQNLVMHDKHGRHAHSWTPTTMSARKPPCAAVSGASAESELRAFELDEFCYQLELPADFAEKFAAGGSLTLECSHLSDLSMPENLQEQREDTASLNEDDPAPRRLIVRRIIELENEVQKLEKVVDGFYASNSWKYTRPLREFLARLKRLWIAKLALRKIKEKSLHSTNKDVKLPKKLKIDVIIPVYGALAETLRCLESVLNTTSKVPHEIVVINDASPDPELFERLREMANNHKRIRLFHNPTNLGFTATVNFGMALHPDRDVVLLNSDTVVSGDWLDRLAKHAYRQRKVGSITPFSNNASICGYPRFLGEEELPADCSARQIDDIASRTNAGMCLEIPTGVGFCMYITRKCLNDIGYFDAKNFPGYGEENDFCMRAQMRKWKHLLAADTFVYHKGAVSFAASSETRKSIALRKIQNLYPDYDSIVHSFIAKDPPSALRKRIDEERLRLSNRPVILAMMHEGTGGTEKHVMDLMAAQEGDAQWFLLKGDHEGATLDWKNQGEGFHSRFKWNLDFDKLVELLHSAEVSYVQIHHTHRFTSQARKLIDALNVPFDFTVHDYAAVCPRVTLTDFTGGYCGEPDENGCNKCLTFLPTEGAPTIQKWRSDHEWLLKNAVRVLAPSVDAASRMQKYFPSVEIKATAPIDTHLHNAPPVFFAPIQDMERLRIAVIGALTEAKGANVLEMAAIDAKARGLPIEFHFIGRAYRELKKLPKASLIFYGQYNPEDLAGIISDVRPHIAWFPAKCPETYCYALSAVMEAALPVVAPNLGAFTERLHGRKWSWIAPWNQSIQDWNDLFCQIRQEHLIENHSMTIPSSLLKFSEKKHCMANGEKVIS